MTHPLAEGDWDAIVIGTGIGGGTIGRALAEAGQRVLFLEQGPEGYRSEAQGLDTEMADPVARGLRGYWRDPVRARIDGREARFLAPLGAGLGGSSVFYAATLERPARHDLDHSDARPHPTGGWPVGFDAMAEWYAQAARMYHLCGTPDPLSDDAPVPLRAPPAPGPVDAVFLKSFAAAGLHPYLSHSAIRHVAGCETCLGRKCPRRCKMDGRSAGVEPALETGRATVLCDARVTRLLGAGRSLSGLEVEVGGARHVFTARRYVLAGGALGSPRLMLASATADWPRGCGNSSGQVGRNLMFHLNEMLAIWPPRGTPDAGPSKAISLRDFYWRDGMRMGTLQAMGIDARYGEIVHYLNMMLKRSALRAVPGLRPLTRIPAAIAARLFGQAKIFVGLLEDMPYADNRLVFDPDAPQEIVIDYTIRPELRQRRRAFRRAIRKGLKGHRAAFLAMQPELNFGHPCGTVRFGSDPGGSVLRPDCRSHDIDNLWVVDASFMPSSFGVNPSLTIAANALRVARNMTER